MTEELLKIIEAVVSFWESDTGFVFVQAYPLDWNAEILYAEWTAIRKRTPELFNGYSTDGDAVGQLRDLLHNIEQVHGVVLDHIYAKREEGHISVLWHLPETRVRKFGWAPVAVAAVPVQVTTEKGVA